jgi:hypothetical protein
MLDKIIEFCVSHYSNDYKCANCLNDECQQSCKKCLEDINFNKNPIRIKKGYDCLNITFYYCGKYGFKYSSEIEKLLIENEDWFASFEHYNIVSIGCGPCTDLYGFLNYLNSIYSEKHIKYCGIDKNKIWSTIHNTIQSIQFPNLATRFIYEDIEKIKFKNTPNIIIMQYLLSDMLSSGYDLNTLYKFLTKNIVSKMSRGDCIIINDINLGSDYGGPRDSYSDFINIIMDTGINVEVRKYYFTNCVRGKTYSYGTNHADSNITMPINNNIVDLFDPWIYCTSAQIIIRKQ